MSYVEKFQKYHCLSSEADISTIEVAVNALYEVNEFAFNYLGNIDCDEPRRGFLVHASLNIMGRIYEQASGMLCCISTKCAPSSEALARVVVESSINLIFKSKNGIEKPLLAYFDAWLMEHERKLKEWRKYAESTPEKDIVVPMIDERLGLVSGYVKFLESIVSTFGMEKAPVRDVWPKSLFKRFDSIGRKSDYYTSYHRLSSSSHVAAEDTISYLLAHSTLNQELMEKVGVEAVNYSIMMSRMAVMFFIDAAKECCVAHGLNSDLEVFDKNKEKLALAIGEIASDAGCPK